MAQSPTPPGLSSELSGLLSRVAAFDAVVAERDEAARQLAAAREALRLTEAQSAAYTSLAEDREALEAEVKALRAQLAMAEEEARRARPMRDALVRELQVRHTCDASPATRARTTPRPRRGLRAREAAIARDRARARPPPPPAVCADVARGVRGRRSATRSPRVKRSCPSRRRGRSRPPSRRLRRRRGWRTTR